VALAALMLTACSSSGKKSGSAPLTGPTYTTAQANAALVLGTDLPAGYVKDPAYQHDEMPGGCDAVDKVLNKDHSLNPMFAVASFRNGDSASSFDHEIELYATPADAAAQYDALIAALRACPSWQLTLGGESATLSLTPGRTGVIGQRSAVLDLKVDTGADKFRGQEVIAVTGNAVVSLAESGPFGSSDDPRVDILTLTTKLVQRLRATTS
jgi:hypothetical protein